MISVAHIVSEAFNTKLFVIIINIHQCNTIRVIYWPLWTCWVNKNLNGLFFLTQSYHMTSEDLDYMERKCALMNRGRSPHIELSVPEERLKAHIYFYDI